jgi:predicted Fe-Mo cluster-binding NifX family protein
MKRVLLALRENDIAPRFDQCIEVMVVELGEDGEVRKQETLVLAGPSADDLCRLILGQRTQVVVCGGIEEEHYQYLLWKKVEMLDGVIGRLDDVLARLTAGRLEAGDIVRPEAAV